MTKFYFSWVSIYFAEYHARFRALYLLLKILKSLLRLKGTQQGRVFPWFKCHKKVSIIIFSLVSVRQVMQVPHQSVACQPAVSKWQFSNFRKILHFLFQAIMSQRLDAVMSNGRCLLTAHIVGAEHFLIVAFDFWNCLLRVISRFF